jgi:hypothetical protein
MINYHKSLANQKLMLPEHIYGPNYLYSYPQYDPVAEYIKSLGYSSNLSD